MKSPWRFIADLTSRRKAERVSASIWLPGPEGAFNDEKHDLDSSASALVTGSSVDRQEPIETIKVWAELVPPAHYEIVGEAEAESLPPPTVRELPGEAEAISGPVVEDEPSSETAARPKPHITSDMHETLKVKAGKKSPNAVKPGKQRSMEPGAIAVVDDPAARGSSPKPLGFLDEASTLDAEIIILRSALAQKLKEQNAQLRKMLTRYDPH